MTLRQWFRTLFTVVVVDPRILWFSLLVPALVVGIASAYGSPVGLPQRLTWGASLLQICGILQVAWGLHGLRVDLGQPRLRSLFRTWSLKVRSLFYPGKPTNINITGVAAVGLAGGVATAFGDVVDASSLDSRVTALEAEVGRLGGELQTQVDKVNHRLQSLSSDLRSETQARGTETADLRRQIQRLFIGGLDLEVAGLVWILCGQVLSTWPHWVASLLA